MEAILVLNCPHCAQAHLFTVCVTRSRWVGYEYVPASPLLFTRLFTCPIAEEDFEIKMNLIQPHGIDYKEIIVEGLVEKEIDRKELSSFTDFYHRKEVAKWVEGIPKEDLRVPPGGFELDGIIILGIYG